MTANTVFGGGGGGGVAMGVVKEVGLGVAWVEGWGDWEAEGVKEEGRSSWGTRSSR